VLDRLCRFAVALGALAGWHRWATAFAFGALAVPALPPVNLFPLLFVSFSALVWMIDGSRSGRGAFAAGWWFGFGHFVFGLYWIGNALLVDADRFAWMLPFAVCGLPAGLAFFTGAAAWLVHRFGGAGIGRILIFAVAWSGLEWLRGHILTGFPWNLIGYVWTASPAMLQSTAFVGIYGLSVVTAAAAASPAALVDAPGRGGPPSRRSWAPSLVAMAILSAIWAGGALRLAGAPGDVVEGVHVRVVQAAIPQQMKWDRAAQADIFGRHLALSAEPAENPPTIVVWPETATPFFLIDYPETLAAVATVVPRGGAVVTGTPRGARDVNGMRTVWNSVAVVAEDGRVAGLYDKAHLVPFGEYVPMRALLGFAKITPGTVDFTAGPGPRTLDIPGAPPVSPLVCYEAIFPGAVVDRAARPGWLLNVTNDAWYGYSAGPHQHVAIVGVRAVEEGLPLVRAANTGISAVFDAYGRTIARLGLGETGVLDTPLPAALPGATVYARIGDLGFLALLLLCLVAALGLRKPADGGVGTRGRTEGTIGQREA